MSNLNKHKLPLILTEPFFQYDINDVYLDSFFVYCSLCSKRLLANNKFNLSALYSHVKGKKHIELAKTNEEKQKEFEDENLVNDTLDVNNNFNNQNEIKIIKQKIKKNEDKLEELNKECLNYKKLAESINKMNENNEKEMEILKNRLNSPQNDENLTKLLEEIKKLEFENDNLRSETSKIKENISKLREDSKEQRELIMKNYEIKNEFECIKEILATTKEEHDLVSNLIDLNKFLQELYNKIELTSMENRILKDQMVKAFI
jgi:chromosome segregation ATPase